MSVQFKTISAGLVAALVSALALLASAAWAQKPPPEFYGAREDVSDLVISPDGARYASLRSENGETVLLVQSADNGELIYGNRFGDVKPRQIYWINDRFVFASGSQAISIYGLKYEVFQGYAIDTKNKKIVRLLDDDKALGINIRRDQLIARTDEEDKVVMAAYDDRYNYELFRVDLTNGRTSSFISGSGNVTSYAANVSKDVYARVYYAEERGLYALQVRATKQSSWKTLYEERNASLPPMRLLNVSADGSKLYVRAFPNDQDGVGVYAIDIATGAMTPVFASPYFDVEHPIFDFHTNELIGAVFGGLAHTLELHDKALEDQISSISKALGATIVTPTSWTKDGSRYILRARGGKAGDVFVLFEPSKGQAAPIAQARAQLRPEYLAEVRDASYEARDGLMIPALMTIPPGREAQGLPMVVLPHGGPEAHDDMSYDNWAQFLANEGYLVLQPNFRGSSGFGLDFISAGRGEWGGKMVEDVIDGAHAMVAQGHADPNRICIFGHSYGGYSALAATRAAPGLFKCVAASGAVTDLDSMLRADKRRFGRNSWVINYLEELTLQPDSNVKLAQLSPTRYADQINAPVLLIHGRDDTRVPYTQATQMHGALKRAGKPVELLTLEDEDHWFSTADGETRMLEALGAFLAKHLQ